MEKRRRAHRIEAKRKRDEAAKEANETTEEGGPDDAPTSDNAGASNVGMTVLQVTTAKSEQQRQDEDEAERLSMETETRAAIKLQRVVRCKQERRRYLGKCMAAESFPRVVRAYLARQKLCTKLERARVVAEERLTGQILHERELVPQLHMSLLLQPFQQWPRPHPNTEVSFMFEFFATATGKTLGLPSVAFIKLAKECGLVAGVKGVKGSRRPAGATLPDQRQLDILVVQTLQKNAGVAVGGTKIKQFSYAGTVKMLEEVAMLCFKGDVIKTQTQSDRTDTAGSGASRRNLDAGAETKPRTPDQPDNLTQRGATKGSGQRQGKKGHAQPVVPLDPTARKCIERMFAQIIFKTKFGATVFEHLQYRTHELIIESARYGNVFV
jgi:hypothetical protein